jgi:hypothetical protein
MSLSPLYSIIETAIKSSTVRTVAGKSADDWNRSVFFGNTPYVQGANRGRCPFVVVNRTNTALNHEFETGHGGTQLVQFTITLHGRKSSVNSSRSSEQQLYDIAAAILSVLRGTRQFEIGDDNITESENHPYGFSIDLNVTAELTFTKDTI